MHRNLNNSLRFKKLPLKSCSPKINSQNPANFQIPKHRHSVGLETGDRRVECTPKLAARKRIVELERKVGQQELELDFFGEALRRIKVGGKRSAR
jgi:hypothetical protein